MTFEAFELEITVNYPVHAHLHGECQFHAKSHELIDTFWLVLPEDH